MDIDVSGWILEFLLRQTSLNDQTLNNLIHILPLPNNNPRLKKTLILRKIESYLNKGTIPYHTLNFLEQIEELDHSEGVKVSEFMKAAYCTVAMQYTAKMIDESEGDKKVVYGDVVKRFWSVRVCEMEKSNVELVQEDLVKWVRDVEAGVLDVDVCEDVVGMFREFDVVEVVRRYVNEAKEEMGCSFLEMACEAVLSDGVLSGELGLDEVEEVRNGAVDGRGVSGGNGKL